MKFLEERRKEGFKTVHAIEPGTDEWDQWAAYLLDRCGVLPAVMRLALRGQFQSFTVPARLPEWFDLKWVPPLVVPKSERWRRYEPTDEERARNVAKLEQLSRELGTSISMRKASERARRQAPDPAAHLRAARPTGSLEPSPALIATVTPAADAEDARDVA